MRFATILLVGLTVNVIVGEVVWLKIEEFKMRDVKSAVNVRFLFWIVFSKKKDADKFPDE